MATTDEFNENETVCFTQSLIPKATVMNSKKPE
jgi:hypothetical protein